MSAEKMTFTPQGVLGHIADMALVPVMYLFQGNFKEVPQRTHVWNNQKYHGARYRHSVSDDFTVYDKGNFLEKPRGLVRFHLPIVGGWKKFLVVGPVLQECTPWHIGWHNWNSGADFAGISLIPVVGPVRVLQGDQPMRFFGIVPQGDQVPIELKGFGFIGKAGAYAELPLL